MRTLLIVLLTVLSPLAVLAAGPAKPRITVELLTEQGFAIDGARKWHDLLTGLGVTSLRIRSAQPGEDLKIEKQPSGDIQVIGVLKSNGTLALPGGKFSAQEKDKIKQWLANLSDQGVEGVTQAKVAFGLLPKQFEEVNAELSKPLGFDTSGKQAKAVIEKISQRLSLPLEIDNAAATAIAQVELEDDFSKLSCGTALAGILRPAGLILSPERPPGGKIQLRVAKPGGNRQAWPVGWSSTKNNSKVLPELFELINVELEEVALTDTLETIQQRLEVPFVYDRYAMALHRVDLSKTVVSLPSKRTSYSVILNKILFKAGLKYELRQDEAGKKFLWITTVKPA